MTPTIAIIIPYCNRREHLAATLPLLLDYDAGARPWVIVVEQVRSLIKDPDVPGKQLYPFNRGLLCNLGAVIAAESADTHYLCFHDVDMVPLPAIEGEGDDARPAVGYSCQDGQPAALVKERIDDDGNTQTVPHGYFGGVVVFRRRDFATVGGFSNQYWGWGDEDIDLRMRVEWAELEIEYKAGTFRHRTHPPMVNREQLIENHKRLGKTQDRRIKPADDGLQTMPTIEPTLRNDVPGGTPERPTLITHVRYAVHRPGIEKEWNDNAETAADDAAGDVAGVLDGLGITPE